jgi:NADH-quinone oxidoreductase subunit C
MSARIEALAAVIQARLGDTAVRRAAVPGDLSFDLPAEGVLQSLTVLRDDPELRFEMLIDIAGVDYLDYGRTQWRTTESANSGFGRGVNASGQGGAHEVPRFAAVYQLMSVSRNERLTVRVYCTDNEEPSLPSVVDIWACANWFEREAFDLFGIVFHGHPDLRRILTDYGFIGHPFRKDFPLIGNVEVRYDETLGRVVYEPVQLVERTLVPRVIRDDNRYDAALKDS